MCGIVGYAGYRQAAPLLLDGLSKLEYRGYDSAGVCIQGPEGLEVAKSRGRLQILSEKIQAGAGFPGWWALVTPGGPPTARHPMKTPIPICPRMERSPWCTMASLKTIWSSGSG